MLLSLSLTWLYYHQGKKNPKNDVIRQKIDTDIQEIWNVSIIQATDNKSHDDQHSPSILKEH